MNNNLISSSVCYDPVTDSIIVNSSENSVLLSVAKNIILPLSLRNRNDIVYLYRLAEESPLTYVKPALKENGLQDYVDADK